jgi:hypothetical protein
MLLQPSKGAGQRSITSFFKRVSECSAEEIASYAEARAAAEQRRLEQDAARAPARALATALPLVKPRKVSAKTAQATHISPLAAFQELAGDGEEGDQALEDQELEALEVQDGKRGPYNKWTEYHVR